MPENSTRDESKFIVARRNLNNNAFTSRGRSTKDRIELLPRRVVALSIRLSGYNSLQELRSFFA